MLHTDVESEATRYDLLSIVNIVIAHSNIIWYFLSPKFRFGIAQLSISLLSCNPGSSSTFPASTRTVLAASQLGLRQRHACESRVCKVLSDLCKVSPGFLDSRG